MKYICTVSAFFMTTAAMAQAGDLSIAGVKLGMTPSEVRSTVKPGYQERVQPFQGKEYSGFADVKLDDVHKFRNGLQDVFYFTFWNEKLIGVSRYYLFQPGTWPLYDQAKADFTSRYGEPEPNPNWREGAEWRYKDGKFVPLQWMRNAGGAYMGPLCSQQVVQLDPSSSVYFAGWPQNAHSGFIAPIVTQDCNDIDYMTVQLSLGEGRQVSGYSITLSNRSPFLQLALKTQADKQKADQAVQEKAKQNHVTLQ